MLGSISKLLTKIEHSAIAAGRMPRLGLSKKDQDRDADGRTTRDAGMNSFAADSLPQAAAAYSTASTFPAQRIEQEDTLCVSVACAGSGQPTELHSSKKGAFELEASPPTFFFIADSKAYRFGVCLHTRLCCSMHSYFPRLHRVPLVLSPDFAIDSMPSPSSVRSRL